MDNIREEEKRSYLGRSRKVWIAAISIFLLAFIVRTGISFNYDHQSRQVMTVLTDIYKMDARNLAAGDFKTFLQGPNPPVDSHILSHPPGYSIFIGSIFATIGESDSAIKLLQTLADCVAAVLIFILALQVFSYASSVLAGALVAFSPQLSIHSQSLLPESIAVLPLVAAVLLISLYIRRERLWMMVAAGIMIGISCWFRATPLLLAPFLGLFLLRILGRKSVVHVLLLVTTAIATIAPITIRNYVVFDRFIPLSLGSGVTLIGGIADYDKERRFNLPRSDVEVAHTEAIEFNRPEYAGSLYNPDGIIREDHRLRRGKEIVLQNPAWFASVMIHRGFSMLEPERVPAVAPQVEFDENSPAWARAIGHAIWWPQKIIYSPAVLLLLIAAGLLLAIFRSRDRGWILLLGVPAYALVVQSALHTEARYTVGIWYFLLIFAGLAAGTCLELLTRRFGGRVTESLNGF